MPSAEKQCAYDGALMVGSAFEAYRYTNNDPAEFPNKTQALKAALNGEYVHLYGKRVLRRDSALIYNQYDLDVHCRGESQKEFKETCKQIRNV